MAIVETAKRVRDAVLLRRPKRLTIEQYAEKLIRKGLDPRGQVVPDPVPIAPPIGYKKQPSMVEIVRDMVRSERLAQAAREAGHETFDESEDFDVGDEPELMRSPWENQFDPELSELLRAGQEVLDKKAAEVESSEVPLKRPTPPEGAKSAAAAPKGPESAEDE